MYLHVMKYHWDNGGGGDVPFETVEAITRAAWLKGRREQGEEEALAESQRHEVGPHSWLESLRPMIAKLETLREVRAFLDLMGAGLGIMSDENLEKEKFRAQRIWCEDISKTFVSLPEDQMPDEPYTMALALAGRIAGIESMRELDALLDGLTRVETWTWDSESNNRIRGNMQRIWLEKTRRAIDEAERRGPKPDEAMLLVESLRPRITKLRSREDLTALLGNVLANYVPISRDTLFMFRVANLALEAFDEQVKLMLKVGQALTNLAQNQPTIKPSLVRGIIKSSEDLFLRKVIGQGWEGLENCQESRRGGSCSEPSSGGIKP